jgi:hypothetical protein
LISNIVVGQEDPNQTVQAFIGLIQRHEQSFYYFVHKVHAKGDKLFDSLMKWIELFLTVVREGPKEPISLEFLLPHSGKERDDILAEVDKVALYHYKLKVLYEAKIRRRFGRADGQSEAEAEEESTQDLVNGLVGELNLGELVTSDNIDITAEVMDEEETSSEESSSEFTETEDESDENEHTGSGSVNGRPMAVSPTLSSPSSSTSNNNTISNFHQQSTPQVSRPSPSPAHPQPAVVRKKSFSLKKSKSMNFSMSNLSFSRHSQDNPPVPPVPPLRSNTFVSPVPSPKPLPPNPPPRDLMDEPPPLTPSKDAPVQRPLQPNKPLPKKKPKKKPMLNPPELEHIPKLLPIFAEIVSSQCTVHNTSNNNFTNR